MVKNEWSEQDLLIKTQNYCSLAEHCVSEVREKLYQWGATSAVQDKILSQLCQAGFIDESRYAAAFVHDKVAFQGWGREKIRMMLLMKHLPSDVVEEALAGIDETVYNQQLSRLIEQKQETLNSTLSTTLNSKLYTLNSNKLARFLAQRGFTSGEIRSSLQGNIN